MPESIATGALVRNPDLARAAVLGREVDASLERVWENVRDWEHLPWLHAQAFRSIELRAEGEWGWRARVGFAGNAEAEIELITDPAAGCYVARTVEGAGAPAEIWTTLTPISADRTAIAVEFCVSPLPAAALAELGQGYVRLYQILWDQDEGMMQERETALAARRGSRSSSSRGSALDLGPRSEVEQKLPLVFELEGDRFRLIEIDGELHAHSAECPHLLGPLVDCSIDGGVLTCPWHGYRFDARTGQSADGRSLRLRPSPGIVVDTESDRVLVHGGEKDSIV